MAKTWSDWQTAVNDLLVESGFASDNTAQIKRSANRVLEWINAGYVPIPGEPINQVNRPEIGYDFQREIQDVPFNRESTGTITTAGTTTLTDSAATFVTDGIGPGDRIENTTDSSFARVVTVDSETQLTTSTLRNGTLNVWTSADAYKIPGLGYEISSSWNYKFPISVRLTEDSDNEFEYVRPEYFMRKKYRSGSLENMFTVEFQNGKHIIRVNWDTTEYLVFDFFSNNIIETAAGVRGITVDSNDDFLLIPDIYFSVPVELTVADLMGMLKGRDDQIYLSFLSTGRNRLQQMINNIGTIRKQERRQMRVRPEMGIRSTYKFKE